jgi:hypothetical protein
MRPVGGVVVAPDRLGLLTRAEWELIGGIIGALRSDELTTSGPRGDLCASQAPTDSQQGGIMSFSSS